MSELSSDQREWIEDRLRGKRRQNARFDSVGTTHREYLEGLITRTKGRCAILGVPLRFEKQSRTPKPGQGLHSFSVSLDHVAPSSSENGHQLMCHFLNVTKANLPPDLFEALVKTPEFQRRTQLLNLQCERTPDEPDKLLEVWKNGRLCD